MKIFYNLPKKVVFCENCVLSNQVPSSVPEFLHKPNREGAKYLEITPDKNGKNTCSPCKVNNLKNHINWKKREQELIKLLDKYRSKNGEYDCIVPGSGGKDSVYAAHLLKYKYGMHPLTVTWPPILYTDYGYQNFKNWIEIGGFDNISLKPDGRVQRILTKLSIENLLHPFQTFILGQKNIGARMAAKFKIPLVFYGESDAEYNNPISEFAAIRDQKYWISSNKNKFYLAGIPIKKLMNDYDLSFQDLKNYLPLDKKEIGKTKIKYSYLGYYIKWTPQEAFYYSVENTNFKARPFRTEGTYSKYNSIDDKIDDLHYFTSYIKFGIGRASYDASQEIRNKHITRQEGVKLVSRFDGETPNKYLNDVLDYLGIKKNHFFKLVDKFRSPHLWKKTKKGWVLRNTVF